MSKTSYLTHTSRAVLAVATAAALSASLGAPAFAATGAGSTNGTVTVGATVVSPIVIAQTQAMNFGSLAANVNTTAAGAIVLAAAGTRTNTGGVDLVDSGAGPTAGGFTVAAQSGYTYNVTLPTSVTLASGSDTMTVDSFTAGQTLTGVVATGSAQSYTVGATLHAGASQKSGAYSGTFTVTAAYN